MEIQIFKTLNDLNRSFTEWLMDILDEKGKITIALSGGSTPKSLFGYWSQLPEGEIDWTKIKFFWGDERCVPPSDEESNFKMTKDHLFDNISVPQENIFRIRGENNPSNEAKVYGNLLNDEVNVVNGIPAFDIIILGLGDDGHTASIFPHEIELWNSNENCVVATHPETGQKRVSITGKVINAADNVAFLVTGESKSDKVRKIIEHPLESEKKYPAALVQPESGNLFWFLDKKAADEIVGDG
ncbi:MAG: 6-phosphogluconolactonase [Fermentimonas sp.]|jgi:6-phosphogluconolactonase|nr:6-phosphogluconolactonase [Fermentimonas sp.]HBT84398.1 6-phosphogluconolactonase [Porphyromonadaceae bacterium]MDD2932062.1 6-phosphogluconolactonase [Fermentimonas sp.]MDD3189496.1 6-phosphogluconolactonase [Fermentimonas sp.]MDD3511557.1 6-phosphogluconolactonase [Fermentimonas sp.]